MDWIHRPTASELAECAILANGDSLFLARVVRLATDIKDSTRMLCRSALASPRRAANSNAALQYQVVLEGLILRFPQVQRSALPFRSIRLHQRRQDLMESTSKS